MKPALEHLPKEKDHSFVTKFFDYHYYPTPWHYHPEYEIVMVTESTGKRFIGDHVSDFKPVTLLFSGLIFRILTAMTINTMKKVLPFAQNLLLFILQKLL
ncbi:MAG: hypothetical protein WDO16_00025 [Bacteroidota bacterium]